ncbi:MAG: GH116 family glycosyl hydrolase, partial [Planctomycetota bacterium]
AQAMAALFPELERNVRELQDFGEGFDERTGLVGFRSNRSYAADGQCGTVLKAYREHLRSRDEAFLRRNWPRIRMALLYLVRRDRNRDGIIEDRQHNTYDISFYGANSFVGALYLAALRAGEEMAGRVGDQALAERLGRIFARGSELGMQRLFDGEYFIQDVDLEKHPKSQYGKGCLSDQLFGQNWARRLGLGYLYPEAAVRSALRAIYRYNWTADVGPYNARYEPERVFARPGEPGLFTCTWPKDPTTRAQHIEHGVRYRSEVWTGIEHQVASHMIGEGLLTQGLHILRGIEDRYDGRKSNPYNEVECGDHYARALASWSSLEALMGFELDGPRGRYVFAPRFRPEDFRAFFAGPAGFGSYAQQRDSASLRSTIRLRHGSLTIRELVLTAPLGAHACRARATLRVEASREALPDRARWTLRFAEPLVLDAERHPELEVVIA